MKYCSKCGNELFDEAVICPKCGCPAENVNPVAKSSAKGSVASASFLNSIAFIINILVLIFLLASIITVNPPEMANMNDYITGEECFACGLRTAVTLLLQGRFSEAYQSNKLIVGIVIIGIVMAADILHHLYQRQKAKSWKDIRI